MAATLLSLFCFGTTNAHTWSPAKLQLPWNTLCAIGFLGCAYIVASQAGRTLGRSSQVAASSVALSFFLAERRPLLLNRDLLQNDLGASFAEFLVAMALSCGGGLAMVYSVRTQSKRGLFAACMMLAMLIVNIAAWAHLEDRAAISSMHSVHIAWYIVKLTIVLMLAFYRPLRRIFNIPKSDIASLLSVRVMFGILGFFTNVVFLAAILVARLLAVHSMTHANTLIALLLGCWFVANALAMKLSRDITKVADIMPAAAAALNGGEGTSVGLIARKTMMAEIDRMIDSYDNLAKQANEANKRAALRDREAALLSQAHQVAHDIKSPLAALNMILGDLSSVSEDTRVLAKNAVFRIQDIANALLAQHRKSADQDEVKDCQKRTVMLSSLMEDLVCEKRLEYRDKLEISIESIFDKTSYGSFAHINPVEIKRTLSNLVNNAVEAVADKGRIVVSLRGSPEDVCITVDDDGPGIAPHVLSKLGTIDMKSTKESGHGLGLLHAANVAQASGGLISFENQKIGARVSLSLPRSPVPSWFFECIDIRHDMTIVVLDDDSSIHGIWSERMAGLIRQGQVNLVHLSSPQQFKTWHAGRDTVPQVLLYLFDYELLGHKQTGLDIIEEFELLEQAVLVTSRFDEPGVTARCDRLGIKILPKSVAALVPIFSRQDDKDSVDLVIIDDDPLVHMAWRMTAKAQQRTLLTATDEREFWSSADRVTKDTNIYIDCQLSHGVRGEDVAKRLYDKGYTALYLATGEQREGRHEKPFIRGVVGKEWPLNERN